MCVVFPLLVDDAAVKLLPSSVVDFVIIGVLLVDLLLVVSVHHG